jgi:hypothetical protein
MPSTHAAVDFGSSDPLASEGHCVLPKAPEIIGRWVDGFVVR